MQFDFEEFHRYSSFFNDDSLLVLSQTGMYKGPNDIREYVEFASANGAYIKRRDTIDTVTKLKAFDPLEGTCTFNIHRTIRIESDSRSVEAAAIFGVLSQVTYSYHEDIVSFSKIYFTDVSFHNQSVVMTLAFARL